MKNEFKKIEERYKVLYNQNIKNMSSAYVFALDRKLKDMISFTKNITQDIIGYIKFNERKRIVFIYTSLFLNEKVFMEIKRKSVDNYTVYIYNRKESKILYYNVDKSAKYIKNIIYDIMLYYLGFSLDDKQIIKEDDLILNKSELQDVLYGLNIDKVYLLKRDDFIKLIILIYFKDLFSESYFNNYIRQLEDIYNMSLRYREIVSLYKRDIDIYHLFKEKSPYSYMYILNGSNNRLIEIFDTLNKKDELITNYL